MSSDMQSAVPATAAEAETVAQSAGRWHVVAEEIAAVLRGPTLAEISELGVIAVSGDDAPRFLQGQLTGEVEKLGTQRLALDGYCTPKGRLLATFRQWQDERAIYLQLPQELLAGVLKRLSMFVLRAKVKLLDESSAWVACAVVGTGAAARLREVFGAAPDAPGDCVSAGDVRVARLHSGARVTERFMLLLPAGQAAATLASLGDLPKAGSGAFWWSEIDAAVPTVFAATKENFVPQMINFEVLGGVNFTKGCYPGQEVVARSQYRGKLKRRMFRAHSSTAGMAGADVYAQGESEAVGSVVMAAGNERDGFDLLCEFPLEKAEATLRLTANEGPALALQVLPYELVDVTA